MDNKELLKQMIADGVLTQEVAAKYCPELKKMGEERYIRSTLKFVLEHYNKAEYSGPIDNYKECMAWLEKQGEQKPNPVLDIEIPFGAKDSELQEVSYHIPEGFHAEIEGNKVIIKKGEQKHTWSEEDERIKNNLLSELTNLSARKLIDKETKDKYVNWLKSLRPQKPWKPSDEQIEVLEHFVRSIGESGYASLYDNNTKLLYSLLEQLKKLIE